MGIPNGQVDRADVLAWSMGEGNLERLAPLPLVKRNAGRRTNRWAGMLNTETAFKCDRRNAPVCQQPIGQHAMCEYEPAGEHEIRKRSSLAFEKFADILG